MNGTNGTLKSKIHNLIHKENIYSHIERRSGLVSSVLKLAVRLKKMGGELVPLAILLHVCRSHPKYVSMWLVCGLIINHIPCRENCGNL